VVTHHPQQMITTRTASQPIVTHTTHTTRQHVGLVQVTQQQPQIAPQMIQTTTTTMNAPQHHQLQMPGPIVQVTTNLPPPMQQVQMQQPMQQIIQQQQPMQVVQQQHPMQVMQQPLPPPNFTTTAVQVRAARLYLDEAVLLSISILRYSLYVFPILITCFTLFIY
jgi:hypothetical protein